MHSLVTLYSSDGQTVNQFSAAASFTQSAANRVVIGGLTRSDGSLGVVQNFQGQMTNVRAWSVALSLVRAVWRAFVAHAVFRINS